MPHCNPPDHTGPEAVAGLAKRRAKRSAEPIMLTLKFDGGDFLKHARRLKRGLRALERDGSVTFKNGSVIEREIAEGLVTDESGTNWDVIVRLVVKRGHGGSIRFADSDTEIRRAYEMALNGPKPKQQPSGDGSRFGDDPPW